MKIGKHELGVGDTVVLDLGLKEPNETGRGKVVCEHAEHLCVEVEVPDKGFPVQGKGCDGLMKIPYESPFFENKGQKYCYGIRPPKKGD